MTPQKRATATVAKLLAETGLHDANAPACERIILEALIAAAADERELCAKVVDDEIANSGNDQFCCDTVCSDVATRIRARATLPAFQNTPISKGETKES